MAYFDSPKNRALWDKELSSLRKERQERLEAPKHKQEEMRQKLEESKKAAVTPVFRARTSYKELLAEEARAIKARRSGNDLTKAVTHTHDKEQSLSMSM